MLPLNERDRKVLGRMLREIRRPITLTLWGPDGTGAGQAAELLAPLAALGPTLTLVRDRTAHPAAPEAPVITLHPDGGEARGLVFAGVPGGYLFAGLVQLLSDFDTAPPPWDPAVRRRLRRLGGSWSLVVYVAANCPPCPWVMRLAHRLALARPERFFALAVDAGLAPGVDAVPLTVVRDARTDVERGRMQGFWRPEGLLSLLTRPAPA
ncbi:MAG: hypothetical protein K6V97_11475 [Actinomycetia bacterium]|nr:hypothetical protein [Actinomycetes bacterium]